MTTMARSQPFNFVFLVIILLAVATGTAWMMSGHPAYPKADCGNNQWLTLMSQDYNNPLCVRGVLPQSEINAAYKKALEQYQQEHRFDPTEIGGIPVDPRPANLIDEVIGQLTKGWNLK